MSVKQTDNRFVVRDSPAEDLQIARASGSYLFDVRGRRYIDFVMGWCVGNFGWDHKAIRRAISRRKRPDYVFPDYLYKPWAELAKLLAEITPGKLECSFRATGGTESIEIALQVAMAYTRRRKFISIEGSYHGNSIGALSIGASDGRPPNFLANCRKINPPLDHRAGDTIERLLRRKDVAAFIMEPIVINLGVLVPDVEFMTRLQHLCRKYGTLLIMDEVATGFGRTGKLFASEHFALEPDIMCVAKAISGGHAGLGATITTAKIAASIKDQVSAYSTYGWHPLGVDAAIASIRELRKSRTRLLANVNERSAYFMTRLAQMKFQGPAALRIKGLAIGVKLAKSSYAAKLVDKCRRAGLLLTAEDDVLMMFPALNLDHEIARDGLDILEQCL